MLMYTSCGWFFDELSGLETVQDIKYAGRVLQLADQLFSEPFEPGFLEHLERAKSNMPEHRDGRTIYEKFVRPVMLDMKDIGAHYALSSLFQDIGERSSIYAYSATREDYRSFQVGGSRLVIGRATVTSEVTHVSSSLCFGVLHLGDHSIACGTGEYQGAQKYEALAQEISAAFAGADFPKTILLLGKYFGTSTYSLTSLFADERRKVLNLIMEPTLREAEAAYSSIYEHHAPLIRFLTGSGTPRPQTLAVAADLCLNAKLRRVLQGEGLDPEVVRPLLEEARLAGATLDATALGLLLAVNIESLAEQLLEQPDDLARLERLNKAAQLVRTLPFEVNLWKTQNICYKILHAHCPNFRGEGQAGRPKRPRMAAPLHGLGREFFATGARMPVNRKPAQGRKTGKSLVNMPTATYRIQFNPAFGFQAAQPVISYLADLGISDLYASPIFKAVKGSTHGYDVVDPNHLNPELGGLSDLEGLAAELKAHNMGWIQDIVPNHMAMDSDNRLLMDILENGSSSRYFQFFDVDWDYPAASLNKRILAPFLGWFYGECLENGEIALQYGPDGFKVAYYNLAFPLRIESYLNIFNNLPQLKREPAEDNFDFIKLLGILYVLKTLSSINEPEERQ